MNDPQVAAASLQDVFEGIHRQQMAGIPILNSALHVQTIGFQEFQGRIIGIVITPWLMNLIMLPAEGEDWSELELGKKLPQKLPSQTYKFMVNEIDGIGKCQTHSLHSPMNEFVNQEHAVAAARSFLTTLMMEKTGPTEDPIDEELLGRIMRGEETPGLNLDDLTGKEAATNPADRASGAPEQVKKGLSRRDLLRGSFLGDA